MFKSEIYKLKDLLEFKNKELQRMKDQLERTKNQLESWKQLDKWIQAEKKSNNYIISKQNLLKLLQHQQQQIQDNIKLLHHQQQIYKFKNKLVQKIEDEKKKIQQFGYQRDPYNFLNYQTFKKQPKQQMIKSNIFMVLLWFNVFYKIKYFPLIKNLKIQLFQLAFKQKCILKQLQKQIQISSYMKNQLNSKQYLQSQLLKCINNIKHKDSQIQNLIKSKKQVTTKYVKINIAYNNLKQILQLNKKQRPLSYKRYHSQHKQKLM